MLEVRPDEDGRLVATFRLPDSDGAQHACVVGEFNDWSSTAHPMQHDGDGFVTTIQLEPGRVYSFRYLLDGERWENDWAADAYVPNEFGGEDSVIDLSTSRNDPFAAIPDEPISAPTAAGDDGSNIKRTTRRARR